MNKAIANILNRFLSVWVEDLNPEQLNLSIFSGKILLKNLKLKRDFLDILGLPFYLESGTVKNIQVKIPWKTWYSSPLEITISDVVVLLKPVQVKDWSHDKEKEAVYTRRKFKLEHFEMMNPEDFDLNSEVKNSGFFGSKILGNLQVCIENVYFRYEDSFYTNEAFVLGGFVKKLELVNCDSLWDKSNEFFDVVYKKVEIIDFYVFVDYGDGIVICQEWYEGKIEECLSELLEEEKRNFVSHDYLLSPCSAIIKIKINEENTAKHPEISLDFSANSLRVQLNVSQLGFIFSVKKFINEHFLFKKSVEDSIVERNFNIEELMAYREKYLEFRKEANSDEVSQYRKKQLLDGLEALEREIYIDDIKLQRRAVLDEMKVQKVVEQKRLELKKVSNQAKQKKITNKLYKLVVKRSSTLEEFEDNENNEKIKNAEIDLAKVEFRESSTVRQITRLHSNQLKFLNDSAQYILKFNFMKFEAEITEGLNVYAGVKVNEMKIKVILRLASQNLFCKIKDFFIIAKEKIDLLKMREIIIEFDNLDRHAFKLFGNDLQIYLERSRINEIFRVLQNILKENQITEESIDSVSDSSLKTEVDENTVLGFVKNLLENGFFNSYLIQIDLSDIKLSSDLVNNEDSGLIMFILAGFKIDTVQQSKEFLNFEIYNGALRDFQVSTLTQNHSRKILKKTNIIFQLFLCKARQHQRTGYKLKLEIKEIELKLNESDLLFLNKDIQDSSEINEESGLEDISRKSDNQKLKTFFNELDDIIKTKLFIEIEKIIIKFAAKNSCLVALAQSLKTRMKVNNAKNIILTQSIDFLLISLDQKKVVQMTKGSQNDFAFKLSIFTDLSILNRETFMNLGNIHLDIHIDTLEKLLKLISKFQSPSKKLENTKNEPESEQNFNLSIENCSIFVYTAFPSSWNMLSLSFSLNYTSFFLKGHLSKSENHSSRTGEPQYKNDSSLQLSHIIIKLSQNTISKTIAKPFRLSLESSQFFTEELDKAIFIRAEHANFDIGFRDLDFLFTLKNSFDAIGHSSPKDSNSRTETQLQLDSLHLKIYDDTISSPCPLLFLKIKDCVLLSKVSSKILTSIIYSEVFYNSLKIWQPFIEPFSFLAKSQTDENCLEYLLESEDVLNMNVAPKTCEVLGTVTRRLFEKYSDWGDMYEKQADEYYELDYEITNKLGVEIAFWLVSRPGQKYFLENNGSLILKHSEVDYFHKTSGNKYFNLLNTPHSICINISKCSTITGIEIENSASQSVSFSGEYGKKTLIKTCTTGESLRSVLLSTNSIIFNKTDVALKVIYKEETFPLASFFVIPFGWNKEEIFIFGKIEPMRLSENKYLQVDKRRFVGCFSDIFEFKGATIDQGFLIEAPYTFYNNLPFDIVLHIRDREQFLLGSGEAQRYYKIGISTSKIGVQVLMKDIVLYSETFTLESVEQYVKIINDWNWLIKVNSASSKFLCTDVCIDCDCIISNSSLYDIRIKKSVLPKQSIGFIKYPDKSTASLQIIGNELTEKSSKFSLNAIGIPECVVLNKPLGSPILLGLQIEIVNQVKYIKILPRYTIKNLLNIPIFVRQLNETNYLSLIKIDKEEIIHYNLSDYKPVAAIQISENSNDWSSGFSLNDIDDFQVKFLSQSNLNSFNESNWYLPSASNAFFYSARITVSSQSQASINITICNPEQPDFKIVNNTRTFLKIKQFGVRNKYLTLVENSSLPWTFADYLLEDRKIVIKINGIKECFRLEEVSNDQSKIRQFSIKRYGYGRTRFLEIYEDGLESSSFVRAPDFSAPCKSIYECKLKTFSVSIFDENIDQQVSINLSEIFYKYKSLKYLNDPASVSLSKFNLIIGSLQIDNIDEKNIFPVLLKRESQDPNTPFFQLKYNREFNYSSSPIDIFHLFEMQTQPSLAYISHELFFSLVSLTRSLVSSFYSSEARSQEISQEFNPPVPENSSKTYFKFIRIHSCYTKLTYRKSSSSEVLKSSPEYLRIISNKFLDFALVTESPLYLKEVIIQNSFQDRYSLFWTILKNYSSQILLQFYKIIGSTEILGNPIGLISKVGTGVYEFLCEPAKGLLIGKKEFIQGVGKGTKSLIGNFLAGGFGSVAGITGSLYKIVGEDSQGKNKIFRDLGVYDLQHGFQSATYKPYKGFKSHGVSGLVLGTFKGLWAVSLAPVAAFLHFSHTIAKKIASEGEDLATYNRNFWVAFPKRVDYRKKIFNDSGNHFVLSRAEKFLEKFDKTQAYFNNRTEVILVTDETFYVVAGNELVRKEKIKDFEKVEVHFVRNKFVLVVKKESRVFCVSSGEASGIFRIYDELNRWRIRRYL